MLLGAHVSIQGGVRNAPGNGVRLGCDCIQIFSKNQRQWKFKPLADEETDAFRENYSKSKLRGVLVHDSYLINVGSPNKALWARSRDALLDEAERCDRLGIPLLNFHPGAHMEAGVDVGVKRIAEALRFVLDRTPSSRVVLLLESMAGQGSTIGHRLEDLARIRELAGADPRIGYCLDTCHLNSAGFDLTTPESYRQVMRQIDDVLGLPHVRAFHLNDSRTPLKSRVDRHENIGEGTMGAKGFRPLMQDHRFADLPMVLETPGGDDAYVRDLKILRKLAA